MEKEKGQLILNDNFLTIDEINNNSSNNDNKYYYIHNNIKDRLHHYHHGHFQSTQPTFRKQHSATINPRHLNAHVTKNDIQFI